MSARLRGGRRSSAELSWPGFVDALSSLLLVIMVMLMIFALAQFFLGNALSGRDAALAKLQSQLSDLANQLALEEATTIGLRNQISTISATLSDARGENFRLEGELSDLRDDLLEAENKLAEAARQQAASQQQIADLRGEIGAAQNELATERAATQTARDEVAKLNQNLDEFRRQLASLEASLDAADARDREQKAVIADLGRRLNTALAGKVQELATYRSEFFGRLKELLGGRSDIVVRGDRFVFQSELLFESGSATLGPKGREQLDKIAETLLIISNTIPETINWVLSVDGHTDRLPINTPEFPSNWELSQARALSVVRYLISAGVPANRLAATGFGPYQPIDDGTSRAANRRNRRIELRLTQS
ncbi:MAG: peptidoglycan -binding protein [Pseudomonadota bacterium]